MSMPPAPGTTSSPTEETDPGHGDLAVDFLTSLVPRNQGERARAFAALLRALTVGGVR